MKMILILIPIGVFKKQINQFHSDSHDAGLLCLKANQTRIPAPDSLKPWNPEQTNYISGVISKTDCVKNTYCTQANVIS